MREGLPPLPPEQSANYVGDVPDEFKTWCRLTPSQRAKFGNHENTYGCALGYDGMYCDSYNPYMVIWNRSIIAVKRK